MDVGVVVPERIRDAEEWRVLGRKLRARSPEVFAKVLVLLATYGLPEDDLDPEFITESYSPA